MTGPIPYLFFPGDAAEALEFYQSIFGGELSLFRYDEAGRSDGPGDAVAHGELVGPVHLCGADAAGDADAVHIVGAVLALLGTAEPDALRAWFEGLSAGGVVTDPLQLRPWGDYDGQVTDRFGVPWLIGHKG